MIPFNSAEAEARLAEIKKEILAGPSREWARDVGERYGWYLSHRAHRVLGSVNGIAHQRTHANDQKKFIAYCATELKDIANLVEFAALLIGGHARPMDEVTAEAHMRLAIELEQQEPTSG